MQDLMLRYDLAVLFVDRGCVLLRVEVVASELKHTG